MCILNKGESGYLARRSSLPSPAGCGGMKQGIAQGEHRTQSPMIVFTKVLFNSFGGLFVPTWCRYGAIQMNEAQKAAAEKDKLESKH